MEKGYQRLLLRFPFLADEDKKQLWGISKLQRVKPGEILIREGELSYYHITVVKGLLRNYIITSEGEERTVLLVAEQMSTGCSDTIFRNEPAGEIIEAIEPTLGVLVDTRELDKLAHSNTALLRLQKLMIQKMLNESVLHIRFHTVLTPEERFLELQKQRSDLILRTPQKHLASYLGIHPGSPSRIKARLMNNKKNN